MARLHINSFTLLWKHAMIMWKEWEPNSLVGQNLWDSICHNISYATVTQDTVLHDTFIQGEQQSSQST